MSDDNTLSSEDGSTKGRERAFKEAVTKAESQPRHFDVTAREYDVDLVEAFLNRVFHVELSKGEEVMTWAVPRHCKPIYPIAEGKLLDMIETSKIGRALYYGTATTRRDHVGHLFNRQSLFERLHVIVLDDIGTKAKAEDLPEEMQTPSYIIESSAGNFQYGYVLDAPIDNIDAAKALVMLMYEVGIADAGGKMPNKLVRLPEGINGKKDETKCDFVSKLVTMDGPNWHPQQLLDALDVGAKWEDVQADASEATKRRARVKGGSTPWSPYTPARASMSGIIDPVAEWLEANDQIISESGDWLTIKCPFKDAHTSGGDTAGYKPLGTGDDPAQRAFHCFHDGCAEMKSREFLQYVSLMDGPNVAVRDDVAELVATYVYDMIGDNAWQIRNNDAPKAVSMNGMRNTYPRSTIVYTADGKQRSVSEYQRWLTSESRVVVMGPIFEPSNPSRLIDRQGDLYVNQYAPPSWGTGPYDPGHIKMFEDFVKYLIPDVFEREYFLDWLAAKCQDMGFRGAAIVMVAQRQGIGRSTLATMIEHLLGGVNVRNEPFEKVVGETQFNEWLEAPFVVSDETLNTGGLDNYRTYEKLKEIIDPRPKIVTINPKYGKQRRSMVHSSFLFLSNHSNALAMSEDDRRFFVISNPHTPAEPEYFMKLNEWLSQYDREGKHEWARHVFRWLNERKVDMKGLLAPPKQTAAKAAMIQESRGDIDAVSEAVTNCWPCEYITKKQFTHAIEFFASRIDLYELKNAKAQISRVFSSMTYPLAESALMKLDGKPTRFRVITRREGVDTAGKGMELTQTQRSHIRGALIDSSIRKALENVEESLDEAGL